MVSVPSARRIARSSRLLAISAFVLAPAAASAAPITYSNASLDPATGITYRRGPSTIIALYDATKIKPFVAREELFNSPIRPRGAPGVAGVDSIGGYEKQFVVQPDPSRLAALGISFSELSQALERAYSFSRLICLSQPSADFRELSPSRAQRNQRSDSSAFFWL